MNKQILRDYVNGVQKDNTLLLAHMLKSRTAHKIKDIAAIMEGNNFIRRAKPGDFVRLWYETQSIVEPISDLELEHISQTLADLPFAVHHCAQDLAGAYITLTTPEKVSGIARKFGTTRHKISAARSSLKDWMNS